MEQLGALDHLLDGEWAQKIVVYAVKAVGILAGVPFGPFLGIPDCAYAPEIHSWRQICRVLLFDQV